MKRKLIVPLEFLRKHHNSLIYEDTLNFWQERDFRDIEHLLNYSIELLNFKYPHLNIDSLIFSDDVSVYGESADHFCLIKDYNNEISGYFFIIPPMYNTRSGHLAQQVFPILSTVIEKTIVSKAFGLSNRPVFIIDLNEKNITKSKAVNIQSGEYLGFKYVDAFGRNVKEIMESADLISSPKNLYEYNHNIIKSGNGVTNDFFNLNETGDEVIIKRDRLPRDRPLTNQPYWFVIKGYTVVQMAVREKLKINLEEFESIQNNKTINAFKSYTNQFLNERY